MTLWGPNLSGSPPAKGCAAPQIRFWIAKPKEMTSRPQPLSTDSGSTNCPSADLGPKLKMAIRQPQTMMTVGVCQARSLRVCDGIVVAVIQAPNSAQPGKDLF